VVRPDRAHILAGGNPVKVRSSKSLCRPSTSIRAARGRANAQTSKKQQKNKLFFLSLRVNSLFLNSFRSIRGFLRSYNDILHLNKLDDVYLDLILAVILSFFAFRLPLPTRMLVLGQLFAIERSLQNDSIDERKEKRLKKEIPILEAFWAWADSIRQHVPPKSAICEALNYAQNQKEGLMNYLKDGHCSISNNLAENSIRPFTIGRKNWLFSGSPKGAAASAAVYSLIETAKANGINPYSYLEFLLQDLPGLPFRQYPEILEDYLPWNSQIQTRCKKKKIDDS